MYKFDLTELWNVIQPAVIGLLAAATRLCQQSGLTISTTSRKLFVSVLVSYVASIYAPLHFEQDASILLAIIVSAFFADDIIAIMITLGSQARETSQDKNVFKKLLDKFLGSGK